MINIQDDKSQWGTMSGLIEYVNNHDIQLHPLIVDVGAANGILNSNSYNLINQCEWSGLLVEPNPKAFLQLKELYSDKIGVFLFNAAIGAMKGHTILSMPEDEEHDQLASTVQNFPKKVQVECLTVNDILSGSGALLDNFGILSVDTEGYDLHVLKQWMLTTSRPQIIITESWPHLAYANLEKTSLLKNAGYNKILHFGENEIFIRKV